MLEGEKVTPFLQSMVPKETPDAPAPAAEPTASDEDVQMEE